MTLDKTRELITMHSSLDSGYNRNAARMVLGEDMRDHGQAPVDSLVREYGLEELWDIKHGTKFESAFKS